jgi:hypothetical protein
VYAKLWYTQLLSSFVFFTGSMTRLFGFGNVIKVNVANGSTQDIKCRVAGDKALVVQGVTGGSVDMPGVGINTHKTEQVQHVAGITPGYSQIQRGNTLEFELSTSSNSVYMTVLSENGRTICKNHEIGRSRNYIIDRFDALLNANKNQKWIDTKGFNHMVENLLGKAECCNYSDFRLEPDFTS